MAKSKTPDFSATAQQNAEAYKTLLATKERDPEEVLAAQEALKTQGKRGIKLPRINLAFAPSNYDYVQTMARIKGQNMTEFINEVLKLHREEHGEAYRKAKEIIENL